MKSYEFNITVVGTGEDVDDAFSNALDKLSMDAGSAIKGEVIYVALCDEKKESDNKDLEN